jgi:hypothetical protein
LTLYTRWGDWFPLAALLAVSVFLLVTVVVWIVKTLRCYSFVFVRKVSKISDFRG